MDRLKPSCHFATYKKSVDAVWPLQMTIQGKMR